MADGDDDDVQAGGLGMTMDDATARYGRRAERPPAEFYEDWAESDREIAAGVRGLSEECRLALYRERLAAGRARTPEERRRIDAELRAKWAAKWASAGGTTRAALEKLLAALDTCQDCAKPATVSNNGYDSCCPTHCHEHRSGGAYRRHDALADAIEAAEAALAAPPSIVRVTKWDGNETTWFTFDYPPSPEASGTLTVSSRAIAVGIAEMLAAMGVAVDDGEALGARVVRR